MKDFDSLKKEYAQSLKQTNLNKVLTSYALPNSDELHSMICGYAQLKLDADTHLFENAESIDYFNYEKELWKQNKPK